MSDEEEPPTEAEEYFAALDYAIPGEILCDNCGNPMDRNQTWLHALSKGRKCSTEMALRMAGLKTDEELAYQKQFIQMQPPGSIPKAFKAKKPSWLQRLLDLLF